MSRRDIAVKTFIAAVVSLLLCGIIAAELPELLTLTNNTSSDFTVRNVSSSPLPNAQSVLKCKESCNVLLAWLVFIARGPLVKAQLIPALVFILHCILRT